MQSMKRNWKGEWRNTMRKQMAKKFFGFLWLMRIPIVCVSILLAMISLNFCCRYNFSYIVPLACIIMAGYIQNDILDYRIDKISASNRPLPSGNVSVKAAKRLYWILVVLGMVYGVILQQVFYLIYLCAILGAFYIYTKYCKSNWLLKNLFTAFTSTTVIFIPIIFDERLNIKVICLGNVAFFFTLGREILMDIRDREGDRVIINVKRPPVAFGHTLSVLFLFISFIVKEIYFFEADIMRYIVYILIVLVIYFLFIKKKSKYWVASESIKVVFLYDLAKIYMGSG